jgi:hypothetical protein
MRGVASDVSARLAELNRERWDPANFRAEFTRDEDLVDFILIVNSYRTKVIPVPPPLIGDAPSAPTGPFAYGETVDGISLGIRTDTAEYRLNHRIRVWITLRNSTGRVLTRNDSLVASGRLFIREPGRWGGGMVALSPWSLASNTPIDMGLSLNGLMGREMTGTFEVLWMAGGPKPGPAVLGVRPPWKLESPIVTFTVVRE